MLIANLSHIKISAKGIKYISFFSIIRKLLDNRQHKQDFRGTMTRNELETRPELEKLFYSAIHDIKEPVRRVQHSMEVLEALDIPSELCTNLIIESQKNLDYVYKLIEDLLLYARVQQKAPLTPVNLNEVLEMALLNLKLLIDEKNAHIIYENLPSVTGYNMQLIRLFQNLITNAIRYNDKPEPEILISAVSTGYAWKISVKDNGPGIKPEYLTRIFEPFKRLSGKDQVEGNGLGLAICESVVNNHGGDISVFNHPDGGAVFEFSIPKKIGT